MDDDWDDGYEEYEDYEAYEEEPEYCPTCRAEIEYRNQMVSENRCQRCENRGWLGLLFLDLFFFEDFPEKWW